MDRGWKGRSPSRGQVLQRVSFPVAKTELVGILHLPGPAAVGGVAVLADDDADADASAVVAACDALAGAGVGALRSGYHERPPTLEGAIAGAAAALRLLKAHPSLSGAVGIAGFGFGAAVAAIVAGRDSRLKVAVLIAPPGELEGRGRPIAELSRTRARVLIVRGGRDTTVPPERVDRYRAVLSQARVTHRIVTVEGADHGLGPAGPRHRAIAEIVSWVRESF